MNKYIGKVYDGYWEVIDFKPYKPGLSSGRYTLQNIYNKRKLVMKYETLLKIIKGQRTVGDYISRKIRIEGGRKNGITL